MKPFARVLRSIATTSFFALLAGVAATLPAAAQDRFPNQLIKIVVPYPVGGSTDLIARQYAEQLTREMGQTVVIDNRPGAATNIGAEAVVRSKPDGYTLLFANNSQILNPVFGPNPAFELTGSLDPVSLVSRMAFVVAANPKVPFNSGAELLAAAKASPGKVSVSSAQQELYVELLNAKARISLLHVPYKGGAPATTDAIGGQVDMVFALIPVLLPHIRAGKLKAMTVTTAKRAGALPDVPTLTELGVDYDVAIWYGLMAPAGTPKPIVERLASVTQKIMASPEMVQKVRFIGAEPASSKPAEFQDMLRTETAFWQQVAKTMPHLVQK